MKKPSKQVRAELFAELVEDVIDAACDAGRSQHDIDYFLLEVAADKLYNAISQELNR